MIAARVYLAALGILGALSVAVCALSFAGVLRPLGVISDSMVPTFRTGDLLIATVWPSGWVRPGDVVVAPNARPDKPVVSHRVVTISAHGTGYEATLRGDANAVADPTPYELGDWVPRVQLVIPGGAERYARLVAPAVGLPILGGLGLLAVAAIAIDSSERGRHRAPRRRRARSGAVA